MKSQALAITLGDPAGIGPEICLRLLANAEVARVCTPVVFGDAAVLRRVAQKLALPFSPTSVRDLGIIAADEVVPGRVDARCGGVRPGAAFVGLLSHAPSRLQGVQGLAP